MAAPFDGFVIAPPAPAESSSQMRHQPYEVFINHYGKDVKYGIASDIYNKLDATGLRVFLDKDELRFGDFFPETLEAAMRSSSVHIAIFSENYVQSPWCLAELEFILQLPNIKFIPIFYHVEPSTLRWAIKGKGIYGEAFNDHEMKSRYNSKKLENWKLALHKASYYMGEIISNQGSLGTFLRLRTFFWCLPLQRLCRHWDTFWREEEKAVNNVVNLVLKELKKVRIDVTKHPVGLDEAEQDFNNTLLNSAAGEVQMVGIWGMGGAGKTTLAKHLFNKRSLTFNGRSCFVSDVREAARKEALYDKQKELLKGLDLGTIDFNNVDRGKEILRGRLKSVPALLVLDDVDHRDQLDALVPDRDSLGKGSLIIVTTRELRVLEAWGISVIYKIRALNAAHAKELFCWHAFEQPSPLLGFEDLAEKFINACHGLPLSLKVFGGLLCGKYRKNYWRSQLDKVSRIVPDDIKSRLRISYDALDGEEKEMFLDVACFFIGERSSRAIAVWDGSDWNGLHGWQRLVNKCLVELDKYNFIIMHDHLRDLGREIANEQSPYRLWSKTQIIKIQPQQVTVRVRGMADAFGDNCHPLQGHIILNTNQGERTLQPGSLGLKIFIGDGDFVDEQYSELSKDLLYLQCTGFRRRNFPSWLPPKKLRILDLQYPMRLKWLRERDADAPSTLEELIVSGAYELKELIISHAYELGKIEGLKSLTSLEELRIDECPGLDGLPGLGESTSLRIIELTECSKLQKIESLKSLTSLEELRIYDCPELDGLLDLGESTSLRIIQLTECSKLQKIESLKSLTSLGELRIYDCPELDGLPGLGESTSLRIIELIACYKLQNIESFKSLTSLEELRIDDCPELDGLPGLGESTSLRIIKLKGCSKLQNIEGLKSLTSLEELRIYHCPELDGLPGLGESTSLRIIKLKECSKLQNIEGLKSLTSLEKLRIDDCPELDGLPGLGESTSLRIIELNRCHKLQNIESLKSLKSLEELSIDDCPELDGLPDLGESTSLRILHLAECNKLQKIESLKSLTSLEELTIYDYSELDGLPCLRESTSLRIIDLTRCNKLQNIEGLKSLTSLEELSISLCLELDGFPDLGELTSLSIIELIGCDKLQNIESLISLTSLKTLKINSCRELIALPNLAGLTSLAKLELIKCYKLEKIGGLDSLSSLKMLRIADCPELDTLSSLVRLTLLEEFNLDGFQVDARLKPPCAVNFKQQKGLKSLMVTANDLSVVEPLISKIQTMPSEVIKCTRTAIDVGSLRDFFTSFSVQNVVEFGSIKGIRLRRPQYADDAANAILICFIIDSLYTKIHFHINADTGGSFDAVLGSGKWVWMGVFPRGSDWLQSKWYEIWASSEDKDVKLKEVWLVMGKQGKIRQAFHHLSQNNECCVWD